MADDARTELIERLLASMYKGIRHFYEKEHPEWYRDERSIIAIARSLDGMRESIKIIDEYEVTRKVNGPHA